MSIGDFWKAMEEQYKLNHYQLLNLQQMGRVSRQKPGPMIVWYKTRSMRDKEDAFAYQIAAYKLLTKKENNVDFKVGDRVRTTFQYGLPAFRGKVIRVHRTTISVRTDTSDRMLDSAWLELAQETQELKTSYEGCHPEIAESLKRGEHIEASTPSGKSITVVAYIVGAFPYRTKDSRFRYLTPIPRTEIRIIGHVEMMKGLLDRGYSQTSDGNWENPNGLCWSSDVFHRCGKTPLHNDRPKNWMVEEVEI